MAIPVVPEFDVNVGKSKESKSFDFHFSAKLARTLAETLYDYKIEAVIREYSTNITDSHNDSGKEGLEGYVHIPTKLNPVAQFVDSGLGMDKTTIFNIYTKFGLSTKEHDNTTNGSLGYGSKSAFAVSEQFTVTSVKDGVKTVVVCYKDRTGLPTADLKSETQTNEPNGTTVEIPVEIHKVDQWQKAAAFVLGAFRIPHKVNTFGIYQEEYRAMLDLCKQCREEGSVFIQTPSSELNRHRSNTIALMGDVAYHLPNFDGLIMKSGVKDVATSMVDSGLYITNFNIGDLDHAPSREAISYDPETYKKVKYRVNKDVISHTRKFMKEFGNLDNDVSFYSFYKRFKSSGAYDILENISFPFLNGKKLRDLDPSKYYHDNVRFLDDERKFGKIRGYIRSSGYGTGFVFSSSIHRFYQERLLEVENPVVVYSDKEKGLTKIKDTLTNIFNHHKQVRPVFYTEKKEHAENIAKWFGVESPICGDEFSPIVERKTSSLKGIKRGSFGVSNDFETVATVITLLEDTYTQKQEKVDLTEEGVCFADSERFEVKGIVKGQTTTIAINSYKTRNLLREAGIKKVVFKNKNNGGKISRSNVMCVSSVVSGFVKQHKKELIKSKVWGDGLWMQSVDVLVAKTTPDYKKYTQRLSAVKEVSSKVKVLQEVSNFHLNSTPMWKQEVARKNTLESKILDKVETIKQKLPLLKHLNHAGESEVEHYLRLEKIIK